jgi:gas vesicle protein
MSESDNDFVNFIAGFVIGGLVGAAVALLLAPQSGEETRMIIHDKSIELKDKAVSTADEARVRAEKTIEDARTKATGVADTARVRYDEQRKKISDAISPSKGPDLSTPPSTPTEPPATAEG